MNIAVCDDDRNILSRVERTVLSMGECITSCESYISGDALLGDLRKGYKYQIYILDIEMNGADGIQTANIIRRSDAEAIIIFMTAHKNHVFKVFEALPFRFLVKPFSEVEFKKAVFDAIEYLSVLGRSFFYKKGREVFQVNMGDIIYLESNGRKIIIHCQKNIDTFYGKISEIENSLDSRKFCRTHASFFVNLDYVRAVYETEVVLSNGEHLPVSRTHKKNVRMRHLEYVSWKSGL